MLTRRRFLRNAAGTCSVAALPAFAFPAGEAARDPMRWVDLRIGTGGHGHTFPGVSVPFAQVQLSPDTYNEGWDWCSGYHRSDSSIMGFSHTHLSGTGGGNLLDFLLMAGTGPVKLQPGPRSGPDAGYRSRFSHDEEVMQPGYYKVFLRDPKVMAELTSTERTGLTKFTFPASEDAWLIVDLLHSYADDGKSTVSSAELAQTAPDTLGGGHVTQGWGRNRHCYFSLQTSQRPEKIVFYNGDQPVDGLEPQRGSNLKAVLHFKTQADKPILVRTGISGVSAQGAARNLAAEQPGFDFDATRAAAERQWRAQLGRVTAELQEPAQKRIFYTALYHMSLGPALWDDADGQYRGMDAAIHTLPAGQRNYTTFSLWDTFRAAHPAYTLLQAERVPDFANSLIRMAQQSPQGMPVWPLDATETGTMTGYHSAAVIAEAINKGFSGIDSEGAYKCMMQRAMVDDWRGLGYYRKLGYIPCDKESESVSKAFEYCYDDWAIAHVAQRLGHADDARRLVERSKSYRRYFNPESTFMEPVMADGAWATPFDRIELGHGDKWRDYTESNAWQTTFGSMNDPAGTIALFPNRDAYLAKLDALFTVPSTLPPNAPPDIAGMVGQYAHGNEPSHHIGYLYVYAGAPWKTQSRVRSLMTTEYADQPDGIAGNEDVGQMSAWFLLSALGFYPVDPVSGNYIVGSPLINSAVVKLGGGKELRIVAENNSPENVYVQRWTLDGKPQQRLWFNHREIAGGATLVFTMGPKPHQTLGVKTETLPPNLMLAEA